MIAGIRRQTKVDTGQPVHWTRFGGGDEAESVQRRVPQPVTWSISKD